MAWEQKIRIYRIGYVELTFFVLVSKDASLLFKIWGRCLKVIHPSTFIIQKIMTSPVVKTREIAWGSLTSLPKLYTRLNQKNNSIMYNSIKVIQTHLSIINLSCSLLYSKPWSLDRFPWIQEVQVMTRVKLRWRWASKSQRSHCTQPTNEQALSTVLYLQPGRYQPLMTFFPRQTTVCTVSPTSTRRDCAPRKLVRSRRGRDWRDGWVWLRAEIVKVLFVFSESCQSEWFLSDLDLPSCHLASCDSTVLYCTGCCVVCRKWLGICLQWVRTVLLLLYSICIQDCIIYYYDDDDFELCWISSSCCFEFQVTKTISSHTSTSTSTSTTSTTTLHYLLLHPSPTCTVHIQSGSGFSSISTIRIPTLINLSTLNTFFIFHSPLQR